MRIISWFATVASRSATIVLAVLLAASNNGDEGRGGPGY